MSHEGLSIEEVRAAASRDDGPRVFLLNGEEDFLAEETTRAIVESALTPEHRGFNLDVVRAGDVDIRDLLAIAASFPMLAERRVVVVKEVDRFDQKELDLLNGYCENPAPSTVLVLAAAKADLRKNPFAAIRKAGAVVTCRPLYENQLAPWIVTHARRLGLSISPDAARMLAAYVGSSLRALDNEIRKLQTYLGGRTTISVDEVSAVVGMSREFSVFELQRAIGARQGARAVEIVEHMIDAGENVPFILVMVTSYLLNVLKIHELRRKGASDRELVAETRVSPHFLQEYVSAAAGYSRGELEEAFLLLAEADERVKTSAADPRQVLLTMLIRLMKISPPGTAEGVDGEAGGEGWPGPEEAPYGASVPR